LIVILILFETLMMKNVNPKCGNHLYGIDLKYERKKIKLKKNPRNKKTKEKHE